MKINYILALLAIVGGLSAAFTSHTARNHLYPTWSTEKERVEGEKVHYISAHHLADLLYEKQAVTLMDARNEDAYESYHIPTAVRLPEDQSLEKGRKGGISVLYGQEEDPELYRLARELPGRVFVLKGGMEAWYSMVLFPDLVAYRVRNSDQLMHIIRRSGFFGGEPQNTQLLNINLREDRYREGC
jgi:rhodanese-related sulfurtransferase